MNSTSQEALRALLKIGGGYLVAKGITDDNSVEAIIAGILAAIAVIWGLLHRGAKIPPAAALWILALMPLVAIQPGCQSASKNVYTAVSVSDASVSAAMRAWGDYVAKNSPPVEQEQAVKTAFEAFQNAELLALDATAAAAAAPGDAQALANSNATWQAASLALSDLINVIQSFGVQVK